MKAAANDKRVELLFEVGCEEIPAGMLPKAEEELRINIEKLLSAESLSEGVTVETFSAPRRLTAWVRGLLAKQPDVEAEVTGPPKSVAYDSVGAPTRAALSFAEKQGVHVSDLYLVQTPKGEYFGLLNRCPHQGGPVCQGTVLPRVVENLTADKAATGFAFDNSDMHIVCPWHGWEFSIATGRHAAANIYLKPVAIDESNGEIHVG